MPSLFRRGLGKIRFLFSREKDLYESFKLIIGKRPINISLYHQAVRHVSAAHVNQKGIRESYERLEYLGDAILGMVVAELLFKKFPFKEEGFLTETRAKIVNRESLNQLSKKIGLHQLVKYNKHRNSSLSHKSVYGDSLEALIGAIYLDRGFRFSKKFILTKLINPHFDIEEITQTTTNYKSKIIEWAQKENKSLRFEIVQSNEEGKHKQFVSQIFIDDKPMELGYGFSKKKAEQDSAHKTLALLNLE